MPGIKDHLLKSVAQFDGVDGLQPITAATRRALDAFQKFSDEASRVAGDANLSPAGKQNQLHDVLKKTIASEVVRAGKSAQRARGRLAERRTKFQNQLPAVDKTDAAGAMMRAEIRSRLFQMQPQERAAYLTAGNLDPVTTQAILEAPPQLTGVTSEQRESVLNAAIERANPGASQRLARDAEAVQVLEHAARALTEHVAELVDLPAKALPEFLNSVVPDQRFIDSDVERITEILAS